MTQSTLQKATDFVSATLATEEAIIEIQQGETHFSRMTVQYFRFMVARFVGNTGNEPIERKAVYVSVDVDPTGKPEFSTEDKWHPLVGGYGMQATRSFPVGYDSSTFPSDGKVRELADKLAGKSADDVYHAITTIFCKDCSFPFRRGGDNVFPLNLALLDRLGL